MKRWARVPRLAAVLSLALGVAAVASVATGDAVRSTALAQGGDWWVYMPIAFKNQRALFPHVPEITPTPTLGVAPTITLTPSVTPTRTAVPTATLTPVPTVAGPEWLQYVNYHRALAKLPPVTENKEWSRGDELHAKYMVKNNVIGHSESPTNQYYTAEGHAAAQNGNVFLMGATSYIGTHEDAINAWMTGPFHMLGIIDPRLEASGFGGYHEEIGGMQRYGATLDVLRGRGSVPAGVTFPIRYPENGRHIPNLSYGGNESPNPLVTCSGYRPPTGPPIALQLGTGAVTPNVKESEFRTGGEELPHCVFDETTYPAGVGRSGLDTRDAVILMPRSPLTAGAQYTVSIEVNDETYTWSFTAGGNLEVDGETVVAPLPAPPLATD